MERSSSPEESETLVEPVESARRPRTIQLTGTGRYQGQGNYQVLPEGQLLPEQIVIPENLAQRPREEIERFGREVGLAVPTSLSRVLAVQRIRDRLNNLGYRSAPQDRNILTGGPFRILPPDPAERRSTRRTVQPDIELPERIPAEVFRTVLSMRTFIEENNLETIISIGKGRLKSDLLRSLQELLTESGYSINGNGDFVRSRRYVIKGGYSLDQLLTPEEAARVLGETSLITVQPHDLVDLNTSLHRFRAASSSVRWQSLEKLAQELAGLYEMSPELIKMAIILNYLSTFSAVNLSTVLKTLGDPLSQRKRGMARIYELVRPRLDLVTRVLEERIPNMGPAPTTITLVQAIEGGYSFTFDQYQEDILDLMNYNRMPQAHLDDFVELIQRYPVFFPLARSYQSGSTLTHQIIKSYYDHEPSHFQILYAFVVNYPISMPESADMAVRRDQLRTIPDRYRDAIYRIYRSRDLNDILMMPVHPLELYIVAIQKAKITQLRDLVAGFGMLVPEHIVNRMIRQTILDSVPDYKEVITRPQDTPSIDQAVDRQPSSSEQLEQLLSRYTDFEITERFGYTGGFENRRLLISNIYDSIAEDGFMLLKEYDPTLTVNRETTLMTRLEDLPRPYLAYGTPFEYRVVELDELIHSFRFENETIVFQHISGNERAVYNISQVTRLQSILPSIKSVNPELSTLVDQLIEIIRRGILGNIRRSREVDQFIQVVNQMTPQRQLIVREVFFDIFYAGMYMRRWLGPGNRYPVRSGQTRGSFSPEPRAILALAEISRKLDLLDYEVVARIRQITVVEYRNDGNINFRAELLFQTIGQIASGDSCIRTGSRTLSLTAYYYLAVCFGEIIPDFDPNEVDQIA